MLQMPTPILSVVPNKIFLLEFKAILIEYIYFVIEKDPRELQLKHPVIVLSAKSVTQDVLMNTIIPVIRTRGIYFIIYMKNTKDVPSWIRALHLEESKLIKVIK